VVLFKVEKKGQMELLAKIIKEHDQKLYAGVADVVNHLKEL